MHFYGVLNFTQITPIVLENMRIKFLKIYVQTIAKYAYMWYYIVTGKKESPGKLENGTGKREPSKIERTG